MSGTLPPDLSARRVISEQQAADFLGLSIATVRRMRRAGIGPSPVAFGIRRVGYRVGALDAWLAAREGMAAA